MARNSRPSSDRACQSTQDVHPTGGYDAEFDPPLDAKYLCPVCLAALRGPLQTKCGHRFCKMCLQRIIGTRPHVKCPVDKSWLDVKSDIFEDVAVEREILSSTVLCSNSGSGCNWRGDLRHLQVHCDACPCAKLVCPNGCEEQYLRGKSEDHLRDCPLQVLNCSHCGETIIRKDEPRHQLLVCPKYPVQCDECGHAGIIREEMPKHTDVKEGNCPSTLVPCDYQEAGCKCQIKRSELPDHYQQATTDHMRLLRMEVTAQKALLQTQSALLMECNTKCSQLISEIEAMKKCFDEKDKLVNQQVERISHLENTNYNGRLYWKIDLNSYTGSNNSSARILSPPFYTSRPGYKLRACLELDGHVTGSTSYTSLFVVLQQGDFDDCLHFPFSTTCGVTLFDQCQNARGNSNFTSTISCGNMPRAWPGEGRDPFRGRLKLMETDALIQGRFCRDGTLFMRIDVDVSPSLHH
ncbi:TNF receptor-associated factor 6-like isoform X2 [Acanthaster planci]|nr:TNF receptor-associated factor 6-like isoform X2 [Acanthaster planci]